MENKSVLNLDRLTFEKITFERKGFRNEKEVKFEIEVQIGVGKDGVYKVTLTLRGSKEMEYEFLICLSGYFTFDDEEALEEEKRQDLIGKNAVAIMMPYLRSEVSLLTAQPETECVVLPPFNINKMLEQQ